MSEIRRPFLERIESAMRQGKHSVPLGELLNFRVCSVGAGEACVELDIDERHGNLIGTLHGGVTCSIADSAMGIAHATTLAEGESFTTLELKINFVRPAQYGTRVRATAKVIKSGRTISLIECDVVDDRGRLIAKALGSCMTLRAQPQA